MLPKIFAGIDKETKGAIKWKLIPGGQIADGKATFTAVRDGVMAAELGIAVYVPNLVPSVTAIYSTLLFGDDVVASSAAALETVTLHCPSCLEEYRKINAVPLSEWDAAPYKLMCREPIKTVDDLKGKRIRATGGNAEMLKMAGAVPVAGTLTEAVNLLQRGGIDCVLGATDWLRAFGYADFAKNVSDFPMGMSGPAIGMLLNRDVWSKFTTEQKKIHLRYAARFSAEMAIDNFIIHNEQTLAASIKEKGVKIIDTDKPASRSSSPTMRSSRTRGTRRSRWASASRIRRRSSPPITRRSRSGRASPRASATTSASSPTRSGTRSIPKSTWKSSRKRRMQARPRRAIVAALLSDRRSAASGRRDASWGAAHRPEASGKRSGGPDLSDPATPPLGRHMDRRLIAIDDRLRRLRRRARDSGRTTMTDNNRQERRKRCFDRAAMEKDRDCTQRLRRPCWGRLPPAGSPRPRTSSTARGRRRAIT